MLDQSKAPSPPSSSLDRLWRWRFLDPGPSIRQTILVGEALKGVVTRVSADRGLGLLPQAFYEDPERKHGHAFWLAVDDDNDGLIDHAWVYAANGIPDSVKVALRLVEFVRIGSDRFGLAADVTGVTGEGTAIGPATVWTAATPYITPQHRLNKNKTKEREAFTADAQLRDEIAKRPRNEITSRRLPTPVSVTWKSASLIGDDPALGTSFETRRQKDVRPPSDFVAKFPTVTFPEPVTGPLAFGFGAHFGLGMLRGART